MVTSFNCLVAVLIHVGISKAWNKTLNLETSVYRFKINKLNAIW